MHRLTLDAAVTEFLRTHDAGSELLFSYMASVPADPPAVRADAATDYRLQIAEFDRMRRKAIMNLKDAML